MLECADVSCYCAVYLWAEQRNESSQSVQFVVLQLHWAFIIQLQLLYALLHCIHRWATFIKTQRIVN